MSKYAIEVSHVSMLFHLSRERVDNAKEYVIRFLTRKLSYSEFWALKDVSFKLEGSGKAPLRRDTCRGGRSKLCLR